jgi:hypothetical protein
MAHFNIIFHLCQDFLHDFFHSYFLTKILNAFLISPMHKALKQIMNYLMKSWIFIIYFKKLSVPKLYSTEMVGLLMNQKGFRRRWLRPNWGIILEYAWRDWGESQNTSTRLPSLLVQIWAKHLLNISPDVITTPTCLAVIFR